MALIVSGPEMKGSLGGMSVFNDKRGRQIIRQPGGPSKEQIRTLASCAGMRDAISEFSGLSAMAGAVRKAFAPQAEYFSDGSYFNRLMGLMRMVADTDMGHGRGARAALDGNVYLLEDFQWNKHLSFADALGTAYSANINAGKMVLEVDPFLPRKTMKAPAGATHFQVLLRGCVIGAKDKRGTEVKAGPLVKLDGASTEPLTLELDVDIKGVKDGLVILGAGVIFYEEIEGLPFTMRGKGAFAVVEIERITSTKKSSEQRKSAMEMMEAAIGLCRMVKKLGMAGVAGGKDDEAELVRVEKKLWRKRLEKLRGNVQM